MNLPTTQQLRCLVALADTLHFGDAADECGLSQPALSSQIARLEDLLGSQLVERTTRKVLVTPTGEAVVAKSRGVLHGLLEIAEVAQTVRRPLSAPMRLGVIPTIAPYLLPPMLPRVRKRYPELRLFLREEQTNDLVESLRKGRVDAALLALPIDVAGVTALPIGDEPFLLIAPAGHEFAKRKSLKQSDLAGFELLLLEDGHCLRNQALAVCDLSGARETNDIRAGSISTLVQMVANGLGLTLLPRSAVKQELRGMRDVVALEFSGQQPARTIGLVYRQASGRQLDSELFAAMLREQLNGGPSGT